MRNPYLLIVLLLAGCASQPKYFENRETASEIYDGLGSQHDRALFNSAYHRGMDDASARLAQVAQSLQRYDVPGPVNVSREKTPRLQKKILQLRIGDYVDENGVLHDEGTQYVQLPIVK